MANRQGQQTVVIIPTYNERESLPRLLGELLAREPDVDVLVVDDASPDGTAALARARAKDDPRVRVLERHAKQGLGRAYADAFAFVLAAEPAYEFIAHMDADGSHPPRFLRSLRAACEQGADLAIGSRYVEGGGVVGWAWYRRALSRFGSAYARTILGPPIRDLTAGYKCFRRPLLQALVREGFVTDGYGFQVETSYRAWMAGYNVVERPIVFPDRRFGDSKMSLAIAIEAMTMVWRLKTRSATGDGAAPSTERGDRRQ